MNRASNATGSVGKLSALLLALVAAVTACGGSDDSNAAGATGADEAAGSLPEWPAPQDPLEHVRAAGLVPERREQLRIHRHSHLDVFFNGFEVTVPAGVGIDIANPDVQQFDDPGGPSYSLPDGECVDPCISPLHTHDQSGIVHTEAASNDLPTLGQFFVEWGVRLDADCVDEYCAPDTAIAVYVDGERFGGNPADIPMTDATEIAIVIGSPPERIPDDADFSRA